MNSRTEKNQTKGLFSSFSINPIHKSRLENFIKRNKVPEYKEKSPQKNKNSLPSYPVFSRDKPKRALSSNKLLDIASKEAELAHKEIELREREEQLRNLTRTLLQNNDEKHLETSRSKSPNDKKEKILSSKVIFNQIESLIEAEADIDKLAENIIEKRQKFNQKKLDIRSKISNLNESSRVNQRNLIKNLCETIVHEVISLAVFDSVMKEDLILDTRENALKVAVGKISACENTLSTIKRNLEKEALKLLSYKNEINEKAALLEEKIANIETISKSIGKTDKNLLKMEENLKKREEMYSQKVKNIEILEKQIENKELAIGEKEKKRNDVTPERKRLSDNSYTLRENILKQKETEINNRYKNLEEKKKQIDEYKSKIKWRLNNIMSLEKKSEKFKCATEAKIQEFQNYVKNEEEKIEAWKEKNKNHENAIILLKEKYLELEKDIKDKEQYINDREKMLEGKNKAYDSIEEFIKIEKDNDINSEKYSAMKFTDFAKSFQQRQIERKKEYEDISREKKNLSEKINSILNLQ